MRTMSDRPDMQMLQSGAAGPLPILRRDFLRLAAIGSLAAGSGLVLPRRLMAIEPDRDRVEVDLFMAPATAQLRTGAATPIWKYTGRVRRGSPGVLETIPGSYLGPTFRVRRGQTVIVHMHNQLPEASITHWHGLDIPARMDGHPNSAVPAGASFTYKFVVDQRAGTYWYHPHPDMRTGTQVFMGLAGLFIVHDDDELALPLPRGAYEVPIVIQDRSFNADNTLFYEPNMVDGMLGSDIIVNGIAGFSLSAATRVYRLRLLNGCNSRIVKLAFSDGTPMTVIGTDGGLMAAPRTYSYVTLAPGERCELWVDFRDKPVGTALSLDSQTFTGAGALQGQFKGIMNVSIDRAEAETLTLPTQLVPYERHQLASAVNPTTPRTFPIAWAASGGFTINGQAFGMNSVLANERVPADTLELVKLTSTTAGGPRVAHPMHFHGRQFQILDRTCQAAWQGGWNSVKDGFCDDGWKDTFTIMPGEEVRLLVRWSRHRGRYVYHCHNLPHEDTGMMRNYEII